MISIIVVTWNSEKDLTSCLESIKKQTEKDLELIIVDNNSKDMTKEIVKSFNPEIFIENPDNFGFAMANNQGINASKGEYVLTLNPDVILSSNFLERVKEEMERDEKIGMISGKLIRPSGVIDSRGISLSHIRRFYDIGQGEVVEGQESRGKGQEVKLIGPCAAAGFYRRKMLEDVKIPLNPPFAKGEIGGFEYFDEDFFAYVEDVDLAWRANIFGWKAVYCSEAAAMHFRGGSNISFKWRQYLSFRNRYLMMIKNENMTHLLKYFLCFLLYDIPRACYLIVSNRYLLVDYKNFSVLIARAWRKRKLQ
ncbi:MAG: glycosyltransferase family 2 protein [bacterium]